jgi:polysaccharide biosynthesis protein VpsQ
MIFVAIIYVSLFSVGVLFADEGWMPHCLQAFHDLPYCDKLIHVTLYGLLALIVGKALAGSGRMPLVRAVVTSCILVLVASTIEEWSNQFFPHRDFSLGDLAANYLGVLWLGTSPLWAFPRQDAAKWESEAPAEPSPLP